MDSIPSETVTGKLRRWLFWIWVGASFLVAIYIGIAAPFVTYFGEGWSVVALALPALMFFMISTGLAWLLMLVFSKRQRDEDI